MNTYVCEYLKDGIECMISFEASSHRRAENLARKEGWSLVEVWCGEVPSDVEAMIERSVTRARIH